MALRINGLIRALNSVRSRLASGIPEAEADEFRQLVRRLTTQVEQICARNQCTPDQLPDPSRRAYGYLKNLNLENLPSPSPATQSAPKEASIKLRNVVSRGDYFAEEFWKQSASSERVTRTLESLLLDIQVDVEAIESCCASHGGTPANLERPSRETFSWLKYLSDQDHLSAHLTALELARTELKAMDLNPHTSGVSTIHLIRMTGTLWRHRKRGQKLVLKVNEGFLYADPDIWRALLHSAFIGKSQERSQVVREYGQSEDYVEIMMEMDALVQAEASSAQGHHHDLTASFDRVNQTYFGGAMAKPELVWNKVPTGRKMGHYWQQRDQVMISMTLDNETVPHWVIDFVMYHELLHKKHGTRLVNGRRMSHTVEFRRDERRYARFVEAENFLANLPMGESF